jgi:phenylalanyl-tRNA synthetase beta chain
MPVIGISVARLHQLLRADVDAATVERLLDEIGCDVEGVVQVRRYASRHSDYMIELAPGESVPLTDPVCGFTGATADDVWQFEGEETVVRLDLLPVRPDIFDAGGLARALRGYTGVETGLKEYAAAPAIWRVEIDPRITDPAFRRPYIQCAIVRNLPMGDEMLRAIMRLQENLHWALCRDRKFASIGAYDLSTLQSPVRYTLVDPATFRFTPLFWGRREPVSPRTMLAEHPKGVSYAHLVADLPLLPALLSANGNVLSLPPIINAEETKLTPGTRDVLIDVTGSNLPVVAKALSILATSLVELDPTGQATLERVAMAYPDRTEETPALAVEQFCVDPRHAARLIGVELSREDCVTLLRKMRHGVEDRMAGAEAGPTAPLQVTVAAYRNDIMHEVDLIEDIAIAYGYHRIPHTLVPTFTAGEMLPINKRSRIAAAALTGLGFTETTNLVLTSEHDHYEKLRREIADTRVQVQNPVSMDQSMLREQLYASLLETLSRNTDHALPQRIFEVGDVATFGWPIAPVADPIPPHSGARPHDLRVIAGAVCATRTGYAEGRSMLDALLREMNLEGEYLPASVSVNPSALPGRAALVMAKGQAYAPQPGVAPSEPTANPIAEVFEVHPEVLEMWKLGAPVVLFSLVLGSAV